jgi:sugar lactone lactonase YvrE
MRRIFSTLLFAPLLAAAGGSGRIVVAAPELKRLIDPGTPIEKVAEGFQFTEGPVWSPGGYLLFSDIYGDRIYRWSPGAAKAEVFRETAGYPNGLTFDRKGRLLICEQRQRRLIRLRPDGSPEVIADRWEGKSLNCPNDVVVRKDGTIYFTDPYWKFPPGATQELDFQGVFRVAPDGKLSVEAKDFGLPNGIGLSPDEKTLYIGDSRRRKVYAFQVARDGSLSRQRLVADLQSTQKGAVDGMKLDEHGNIYTTGPGGIWIISASGQHLGTIEVPEIPANCGWGDSDYRTLYLTAPTSVYRVRTLVRGKSTYDLKSARSW